VDTDAIGMLKGAWNRLCFKDYLPWWKKQSMMMIMMTTYMLSDSWTAEKRRVKSHKR
jgi:hypothetical protein